MGSVGGGIRNIPIIPIILAGPRDRFFRVIFKARLLCTISTCSDIACASTIGQSMHMITTSAMLESMHVSKYSNESAPHPSFITNIIASQLFVAG
jgi:hypothetical protein